MDSSTDWQNTYKTNLMRMKYLLQEKKYVDCNFLVGINESEQEEFSGHKAIFSMVSPVFDAMFYGSLAEKSGLIKIPDISPNIFQSMMEYIYFEKCDLASIEETFELSYAAKKYSLKDLDEKCINYLKTSTTSTNACQIYDFAEFCSENGLMETCKEHISIYTEDVLSSVKFLSAKPKTVLMILDLNQLNIESELILFNALQKYADEASKKQVNDFAKADNVFIKEAVRKIRFLTMTPQEFSDGPGRSQLLTNFEGYSILLNISSLNKGIHAMPEGFCLISEERTCSVLKPGRYCDFCDYYNYGCNVVVCPNCRKAQ